jgi:trimethylamine corrinoid protein
MAAEAMKAGMEVLRPKLLEKKEKGEEPTLGKVIIGTVEGDIHNLGKNIVIAMLEGAGFEVYDLGEDVPTEKFIEKAIEVKPDIVASSALLTPTMIKQKEIEEALKKAGIREKVKTLIGGAPVSEDWRKEIGADGYAEDAIKAVIVAKKLLGKE